MKHIPQAVVRRMKEMKSEGITHREITERSGYTHKQVKKFFERQNKKSRMGISATEAKRKGRPRIRPMTETDEMAFRIKELEREVELLRSFLRVAGRM